MSIDIKHLVDEIDICTITYRIVANICVQILMNDPEHSYYEITKCLILTNIYELLQICDDETRNMLMIGNPGSMWNNYMVQLTKKFKVHKQITGGGKGNIILKLLSLFYIVTTVTQATIITTKTKVENTVKEALLNPGHISAFKNTYGI